MARASHTVPEMLREVSRNLGPETAHELTLAQYLREAFALTLAQVKPIGGWYPNGEGELSDPQLNDIIMPEIAKNRQQWDRLVTS
jgi:hypothetical protein